jgi:prepilin-type N-terminal cleavage/methylation domain-containing protein
MVEIVFILFQELKPLRIQFPEVKLELKILISIKIRENEMEIRKHDGFSLVELLAAIAIFAIVLAFAIPAYNTYTLQANRGPAQAILNELMGQAQQYYVQNNSYPASITVAYGTAANIPTPISGSTAYTYNLCACPNCSVTLGALGVINPCAAGATNALAVAQTFGQQAKDTTCYIMYLDSNGNKSSMSSGFTNTTAQCF